ncbi:hypothetical protein Dimus_005120 [Dionaea muscipula]
MIVSLPTVLFCWIGRSTCLSYCMLSVFERSTRKLIKFVRESRLFFFPPTRYTDVGACVLKAHLKSTVLFASFSVNNAVMIILQQRLTLLNLVSIKNLGRAN